MPNSNDPSRETTLGVDIGGANLKYADCKGNAHSVEFPLWLRPNDLAEQLVNDVARFADATRIIATMTGELADCFLDRSVGVQHIVDQLCRATSRCGLPEPLFYAVDGQFHHRQSAVQHVDLVAASNWHALASFVARYFDTRLAPDGLLVDVGSTTSDLIPLHAGKANTASRTDFDRLAEGSLVYLGGQRTPVCALVEQLALDDLSVPVMREVFATMDDVRLLLGYQSPDGSDCRSADGKPRDAFHAANRMARMIGLDHRSVDVATAKALARQVHDQARERLSAAIARFRHCGPLVVSGHCSDLLPKDDGRYEILSLREYFGDALSRCAPAYAVAKLYIDR